MRAYDSSGILPDMVGADGITRMSPAPTIFRTSFGVSRRLPRHVDDLVDQRPVMFNHCLPAGLHARRDQTVLLSELVGNDFELAD